MKSFLLVIALSILSISAQIKTEIVFQKNYNELPFPLRIENSGIYAISGFDILNDKIAFKTYDNNYTYVFSEGSDKVEVINSLINNDAVIFSDNNLNIKDKYIDESENSYKSIRIFASQQNKIAFERDGKIYSQNEIISSVKVNPDKLILSSNYLSKVKEINYSGSLAYASIIGIDKHSNHFLLIEEFVSHSPLMISRSIIVVDASGELRSKLSVPLVKYLSLLKEFQIDEKGNLFHLYTEADKILVLKISGLTSADDHELNYPAEFQKEIHFNNYVKIDEYEGDKPEEVKALSSRLAAIKLGEKYVLHKYVLTADNLAPSNITAPDGDIVRTPAWLVEGVNSKVPYKWGGFQTLEQFSGQLPYKRYAGDIHTSGVSSYAVGVDCSGFVSRCWQLTYHSATSMMPNITTQYDDWNLIKPGDAIHKVGHVRLFVKRNDDGSFKVVESSARDWGVSYWSYKPSDLISYTARCYNNMSDDFSFNQPDLVMAEINSFKEVELTWNADTSGVSFFKIYGSMNGKDWTELTTAEKESETIAINNASGNYSFRISSVVNNGIEIEGNWSNVLSASSGSNSDKILIVDGFEREDGTGSWQGAGHTFVSKYAASLKLNDHTFESVQNSKIIDGSVTLTDYKCIFWILGDESTVKETFNSVEQSLIKDYLESGGNLFVSGSEIGWDLYSKGSESDKEFYTNYLKAEFISDDSGVLNAFGIDNSAFNGLSIRFGQTYEEDYPDVIQPNNGSFLCLNYTNNKGAGIQFDGNFGTSAQRSKLIHIAFPVETVADDTVFNSIISKSLEFFNTIVNVENEIEIPQKFELAQNYPNPFNPNTSIEYSVPSNEYVSLKVYDILGNEIVTLVNEQKEAGNYEVNFDAGNLSSGVYLYRLKTTSGSVITKKLLLLK